MESSLTSALTSGFSYKNEVKSIISVQQGARYGFIIEIQSPMGTYYCPIEGVKDKNLALKILREKLKR